MSMNPTDIWLNQGEVDVLICDTDNDEVLQGIRRSIQQKLQSQRYVCLEIAETVMIDSQGYAPTESRQKVQDLQECIKERLGNLMQEVGVAQIMPDGSIRVSEKNAPNIAEASEIQRRFEHAGLGLTDVCEMFSPESWEKNKDHALSIIRSEKFMNAHYSWLRAHQFIGGMSGEFLLHLMLQRMVSFSRDRGEHDTEVLRRSRNNILPQKLQRQIFPFSLNFTTEFNCELCQKDLNGTIIPITEFDGAILSGLKPGTDDYSRLYILMLP